MENLPNELIVAIFDHTAVEDLLRLNEVCSLWAQLEPLSTGERTALKIVINNASNQRSNSLIASSYSNGQTIVVNDDGTVNISQKLPFGESRAEIHLSSDSLPSRGFINRIIERMPKLVTLEVSGVITSDLHDILMYLLRSLSPKLRNLKLSFEAGSTLFENFITRTALFRMINRSLTALRHFHFECEEMSNIVRQPKVQSLPVLGQLERFFWYTPFPIKMISLSLRSYGANNQNLVEVGIGNSSTGQKLSSLRQLIASIEPHMARRFTSLPKFTIQAVSLGALRNLTAKFTNLTSLHLEKMGHCELNQLVDALSPLRQLICLHVNIESKRSKKTKQLPQPMQQLPSVKSLSMSVSVRDHRSFDWNKYMHIFPSVEVINIKLSNEGCSKCGRYVDVPESRRQCAKHLVKPLKAWQFLRQANVSLTCRNLFESFTVQENFIKEEI